MPRGLKEYIGDANGYALYAMQRNNAKVVSIQNDDDEEVCFAKDEAAARQWCQRKAEKTKTNGAAEVKPEVKTAPVVEAKPSVKS